MTRNSPLSLSAKSIGVVPQIAPEAVDHHQGRAASAAVDVVQPLAVDLDELTERRHRGFDLPRGVGRKHYQPATIAATIRTSVNRMLMFGATFSR